MFRTVTWNRLTAQQKQDSISLVFEKTKGLETNAPFEQEDTLPDRAKTAKVLFDELEKGKTKSKMRLGVCILSGGKPIAFATGEIYLNLQGGPVLRITHRASIEKLSIARQFMLEKNRRIVPGLFVFARLLALAKKAGCKEVVGSDQSIYSVNSVEKAVARGLLQRNPAKPKEFVIGSLRRRKTSKRKAGR